MRPPFLRQFAVLELLRGAAVAVIGLALGSVIAVVIHFLTGGS